MWAKSCRPTACRVLLCGCGRQGRVLHNDPGLRRPITLAYSQPGDLVGWAGLAARRPCEWVTAVSSLKLIGIKADDFYELEQRSASFRQWLDQSSSPAELMAILAPSLRQRPMAEPPERDVLHQLLPGLKVLAARDLRELPDYGALWFWNAQPPNLDLPTGSQVDPSLLATIPSGFALRLLRLDSHLWELRESSSRHLRICSSRGSKPLG